MKNLKKVIIAIIIIIILLMIMLGIVLVWLTKDNKENQERLEQSFEITNKLKKLTSVSDYFIIKSCMERYKQYSLDLYYLQEYEEGEVPFADTYKKELLGIIPQVVKDELKLNSDNIYQKIGIPDKQLRIDKIYKSTQTINTQEYENETELYAYAVETTLIDRDTNQKDKISTIVLIDFNNYTYYIIPQLYIEQKGIDIEEEKSILLYQEKTIARNEYNGFKEIQKTQSEMVAEYVARMRMDLQYDVENMYNQLDKQYAQARFGSLEAFKAYVENNKQELMKITPAKYKIDQTDDYTQYTILTPDEDYYIFRETAVMEYSVILDTYSIDLPEFLEKYNKATEQEKVAMNISKFVEAINKKDYQYAYSKLADSFKDNYFKTQASFEQYIKTQYYNKNQITFGGFNNQANTYTYTTTITNKETKQTKNQNFVVRLKEGTDFEMSFEVK